MLFLSVRPTLFLVQSRSLSGRHVSTGFLDPVLGAMMKQVCWHSRRSKAYRGLPEARIAGATVEETAFEDVNIYPNLPFMTLYGNLKCGRAKSGRRDLMESQRVARPSLERGIEAASGKKRTPQHEGVTEGRGGNGSKPPPPIQCATHPIGHPQGGLLSITLYFSNAGNASAAIFWFLASAVVLRKDFSASAGNPQASTRALADM